MMLILALVGFAIALGLFGMAMIGMALMVALRVVTAILWVAIKITERRTSEPEILIRIEDDERPVMRDVTPRPKAINSSRGAARA